MVSPGTWLGNKPPISIPKNDKQQVMRPGKTLRDRQNKIKRPTG